MKIQFMGLANSTHLDELVTRVPGVWRSNALARGGDWLDARGVRVRWLTSGHAPLDAQLPGGGWPSGGVIELLQPQAAWRSGQGVWQLLAPALAQAAPAELSAEHAVRADGGAPVVLPGASGADSAASARTARSAFSRRSAASASARAAGSARHKPGIALIGAPQQPFAPALHGMGLAVDRLVWVRREAALDGHATSTDLHDFWATEQALRCADVAAVVAWLPRLTHAQVQRLNQAASGKWLFVWRPESALKDASPARLRLWVGADFGVAAAPQFGSVVRVLKRQGPPMVGELRLGWQGLALPALQQRAVVSALPPSLAVSSASSQLALVA